MQHLLGLPLPCCFLFRLECTLHSHTCDDLATVWTLYEQRVKILSACIHTLFDVIVFVLSDSKSITITTCSAIFIL